MKALCILGRAVLSFPGEWYARSLKKAHHKEKVFSEKINITYNWYQREKEIRIWIATEVEACGSSAKPSSHQETYQTEKGRTWHPSKTWAEYTLKHPPRPTVIHKTHGFVRDPTGSYLDFSVFSKKNFKVCILPLHCYGRPTLVPVFISQKKPEEDFTFTRKWQKAKIVFNQHNSFAASSCRTREHASRQSGATKLLPPELHSASQQPASSSAPSVSICILSWFILGIC